jgi:predicted nucleic acid-binding protein
MSEEMLPQASSIAALTLAELTSGPLSTSDPSQRAELLERLGWAESKFEAIPFDAAAAHAYGRIYAAATAAKQKPCDARAVDLLIAATALSRGLPLYTRSQADFTSVSTVMEISRYKYNRVLCVNSVVRPRRRSRRGLTDDAGRLGRG